VARRREAPRRELFWPAVLAAAPNVTGTGGMTNPFEFIQQVRSEGSKVVWPTRRETLITTGLVLLLVLFAGVFFTVVDEALRILVGFAIGVGRGG
jgi:preprotein translocase subunit SecE